MARGLGLLLTAMLVVRCLIEVLAPHFEVLNKRLYIFGSAINTCAMDLVIVAIGTLIFCLYGMVAFHIKKSLQYIYFQCNGYSAIVLVLSCSSVLHVIGMFFLVRSFWTAKLPVIIQILHLVPSTTVELEVILQGEGFLRIILHESDSHLNAWFPQGCICCAGAMQGGESDQLMNIQPHRY